MMNWTELGRKLLFYNSRHCSSIYTDCLRNGKKNWSGQLVASMIFFLGQMF
jgi:hypothetical protein